MVSLWWSAGRLGGQWMDVERYLSDGAQILLIFQQNRILARQGPAVPPTNWQRYIHDMLRYWPTLVLGLLVFISIGSGENWWRSRDVPSASPDRASESFVSSTPAALIGIGTPTPGVFAESVYPRRVLTAEDALQTAKVFSKLRGNGFPHCYIKVTAPEDNRKPLTEFCQAVNVAAEIGGTCQANITVPPPDVDIPYPSFPAGITVHADPASFAAPTIINQLRELGFKVMTGSQVPTPTYGSQYVLIDVGVGSPWQ
jgi:hypothetical protein